MAVYTNRGGGGGGYEPDGVTIVLNEDDQLEGVGGVPPDGSIGLIKLDDVAALSVLGNGTNATDAVTAIQFGTDGFVLRRSGTTVAAGTLAAGAFAANTIPVTAVANASAAGVLGRSAASAGAYGLISASGATDGDVLTVQADGSLAWEAPSGGGGGSIDGSGAAGRLSLWSDANTLTSFATLVYDSGTKRLGDSTYSSITLNDAVGTTLTYDTVSLKLTSNKVELRGRLGTMESAVAVASASTVTLRADAVSTLITGTSTINHITTFGWSYSELAMLRFAAACTLANNAGSPPAGTAPIRTRTGANRTVAAGSWTLLSYDPDTASWYEMGL